ncbi:hypothetical protein CYLTODRAFT_484641 [Cylindrobasidium torrendii FP15055 ss-10]|uniref:Uncharacterized protein n=1 Tax=Cylindrobasidium torrendii FP15055 ss-10 TaxID=1314674 RepID=A0A0D7BXF7_9AGAR|nr:hypothetical protein CYLTODRAFT_484641 [Cylindrobasidium torrendii FP15055 ss-10]
MPPKPKPSSKAPAKVSNSKDLISLGSRHVQDTRKGRRDANGNPIPKERGTTTKALILRNAKNGAGAGELVAVTRLTGREKLDLLAEDLIQRTMQQAVSAPFDIETCLRIAESQFSSYLDDIHNLHDPDFFQGKIDEELKARVVREVKDDEGRRDDAIRDPAFIASTIAARVHNAYLLASAWKIVADNVCEMQEDAVVNENIKERLEQKSFRARYLCLRDVLKIIVDLTQLKVATFATTSPHYSKYFVAVSADDSEKMTFDKHGLKDACKSFLDSIMIEMCFPQGEYPKSVLFQILHDAVEEAPREAKRFPQTMWDAIGDLSVCVQLMEMIEAPLLGPNYEEYLKTNRDMPKAFTQWTNAEQLSDRAADLNHKLERLVSPLTKVSNRTALDSIWKQINLNYQATCNKEPDVLWNLSDALYKAQPRWSYAFARRKIADDSDADDSGDEGGQRKLPGKKKTLAIKAGYESDDSMPPLQDVSQSDESEMDFSVTEAESVTSDEESEYDTDEEDEIRGLIRDAMDTAHDAEWLENNVGKQDNSEEDRQSNPFLRLLGSLRGRVFNSNPKVSPRARPPKAATPKTAGTKAVPAAAAKSTKTTVEDDDDDEDEGEGKSKSKKKKKPKKKKKTTATAETLAASGGSTPAPVAAPAVVSAPEAKAAAPPSQTTAKSATTPQDAPASTVSSAAQQPATAKEKAKSRGTVSNVKGVLTRFGVTNDPSEEEQVSKGRKRHWYSTIGKKSTHHLQQVLNTSEDVTKGSPGMKWDTFVKMMTDMGFTHNPSPAGSAVRFDPPGGSDRSITFHQPHPGPYIHAKMLKEFSKKLRKYYGWAPEELEGNL